MKITFIINRDVYQTDAQDGRIFYVSLPYIGGSMAHRPSERMHIIGHVDVNPPAYLDSLAMDCPPHVNPAVHLSRKLERFSTPCTFEHGYIASPLPV